MGDRPRSFKPKKKKTRNYAVNKDTNKAVEVPDRKPGSRTDTERVIKNSNDTYTIESNGKRQTLTKSQWDNLRESKKAGGRGTTPIKDPDVEKAYQTNKALMEQQRLDSPAYKEAIESRLREEAATQQIEEGLKTNPEPFVPDINPDMEGEPILSPISMMGGSPSSLIAATTSGLIDSGETGEKIATFPHRFFKRVGRIPFAGPILKFAYNLVTMPQDEALDNAKSKTSELDEDMKDLLSQAKQGIVTKEEAKITWAAINDNLSQAMSELKMLENEDKAYFIVNGQEEMVNLLRMQKNMVAWGRALDESFAVYDGYSNE